MAQKVLKVGDYVQYSATSDMNTLHNCSIGVITAPERMRGGDPGWHVEWIVHNFPKSVFNEPGGWNEGVLEKIDV